MLSKRLCLLVVVLLALCPRAWGTPLTHAWSDRFGNGFSQWTHAVATDDSGNVVVTGEFSGSVDFGGGVLTTAGNTDIFLVKFDAAGNHVWSQRFGDASSEWGIAVTIDGSGNVIASGYFMGSVDFGGGVLTSAGGEDIYVAKFDAAGNHIWSQHFGDASNQRNRGVTTDGSGNVIICGEFWGGVDFGGGVLTSAGSIDIYVAKFDASGGHVWSRRFGDTAAQYAEGVAVDGSGNVILAGYFSGTVDFGGGGLSSAGGNDIYVAKYDAAGTHAWSQRFGDASNQSGRDVVVDGSGSVVVTGSFAGTADFGGGVLTSAGNDDIFVAKFDASGNHVWSQRFGDASHQNAYSVTTDGWGNVSITGDFYGAVDFGGGVLTDAGNRDVFVARFFASGNHSWSRRFGDASFQTGRGVAAQSSGSIALAGYFEGTVDFGGGALTSAGSYDIFVARFAHLPPVIRAVRDVPGDQGGWVNVAWDRADADTPTQQGITRYTVWRAINPTGVSSMLASGATLGTEPPETLADAGPFIRAERVGATTYYWYLISSLDAYYLPGYSAPVPTLFDSTGVSSEYHYFQVIAHTSNPGVFYASDPDSGYSVDNLSPCPPQSLLAQQSASPYGLTLSWKPNTEADLSHYAVYRGTSADFVPGPGNLIASPTDTTAFDGGWQWSDGYHYKVSAIDIHENESLFALLTPEDVTGIDPPGIPRATYLSQNYPNPFNPSTTIAFGLDQPAEVTLAIYDVAGRLVRVLVEGLHPAGERHVTWNGLDDRGSRVATGVYFYRLTAPGFGMTRKMVLLQ